MLPESDLWVVPPSNHSAWFARLDWYLNLQMCKGLAHRPVRPSAEVEELARDYDVPIPFAQVADPGPLLIAGQGRVPAKSCLVLPFTGDLAPWMHGVFKYTSDLAVKTVSVFLPARVAVDAAEKAWAKFDSRITVQFIPDLEELMR